MANPHKGEVEVKAQERSLTLCFDLEAFAALEAPELGDHRVDEVLAEMAGPADASGKATFRQPRLKTKILLLYAATRRHHPEVTLEEAEALMFDGDTSPLILWPMLRALAAALGKEKEVSEEGGGAAGGSGPQPAAGISTDS